jgi:hypothetical protein
MVTTSTNRLTPLEAARALALLIRANVWDHLAWAFSTAR